MHAIMTTLCVFGKDIWRCTDAYRSRSSATSTPDFVPLAQGVSKLLHITKPWDYKTRVKLMRETQGSEVPARQGRPAQTRRPNSSYWGLMLGRRLLSASPVPWELVVGLEVHAQIKSKSKLFSGAAAEYEVLRV
jgi:hypothetical protein